MVVNDTTYTVSGDIYRPARVLSFSLFRELIIPAEELAMLPRLQGVPCQAGL